MIKRIKTGLRASLFTAVFFSILLAASIGALAVKGTEEINCFFERPGAGTNADVPAEERNGDGSVGAKEVIPGGMPFGVKLYVGGPVAEEFAEIECDGGKRCPARDAGLEKGDVITCVDGVKVSTAEEVVKAISSSSGKTEICVLRNGEPASVTVTPITGADGVKRIGLLIKDCTAGIGTVTFIVPETGEFMGLGHGICDAETGKLVPLNSGVVTEVKITGAEKGQTGDPGELKGYFESGTVGIIRKNTSSGVLGYFRDGSFGSSERIALGEQSDLKAGDAYILSTVRPGKVEKYSVRIESVPDQGSSNVIELRITDPDLIDSTGGIVQGMSGSPIIQNGKLVGAVTHVMINDPVRGYGIPIGEMLKEADL
ncbi:MAG: PDZ domain-containing protein [Clostridia bacterium]|nr:PDZ domain-containing protein [Clostridia bacterium]